MPEDYYLVLGIPADSTQREIKAAYRRLVKEFHPDRCGHRHTPFLGIQEAYSVLGDPVRRKQYDETLREADRNQTARRTYSSSHPETVEPLIPERPPAFGHAAPAFFRSHRQRDRLFNRLFEDFPAPDSCRPAGEENVSVEVAVTPQQAALGGAVRLILPARLRCRACGGSGERGFFTCARCRGSGTEVSEYSLRLEFPPGVAGNSTYRLPLERFGLRSSWLTVRFRIR